MYKGKKISLVFPAFNEEKNIERAINGFRKLKIADQIIVSNNNSTDRTYEIAKRKKVTIVNEYRQGYGFAIRRGLGQARGEYIFLCEPDGTFVAEDAKKLLEYIDHYDMVVGSRTHAKFIDKKANMHGVLRLGNIMLAKFMQLLYQPNRSLTDCGCTFRVIKKSVVKKVLPKLRVGGSHFLPEFLIVSLLSGFKVIEIPVHYKKRIGESKITGSLKRTILVGFRMLWIIITYRI